MKTTAYIKYSTSIGGIEFNSLEVELAEPQISLTLKTFAKRTSLDFVVANSTSLDQSCGLTQEIAERILTILAYHYSRKIEKLCLDGACLEDVDENGNTTTTHLFQARLGAGAAVFIPIYVNNLDKSLIDLINVSSGSRKLILCQQFRFAMQNEDAVSRYMFFYSILLQLCDDDQKKVDEFIRNAEPTVEQSPSPKHPKKNPPVMETVYTKLRNEIAHVRDGATLEATSTQIRLKVDSLQSLIKQAIELYGN